MKPIFLYLASLVVTQSAFAVDKQVTCDGTNCAVKIYSRVGSTLTESATISGGGSAIKGSISGAAIGAGYVGEKIAATLTTDTTVSTSDSESDVTGASITLTAGTWAVYYGSSISLTSGSVSATDIRARVRITDSSNNAVAGSASLIRQTLMNTNIVYQVVSRSLYIQVASSTTYKLRIIASVNASTFSAIFRSQDAGIFAGVSNDSYFYAVRIA